MSQFLHRPWNNGLLEYWNIGLNKDRIELYNLIKTILVITRKGHCPYREANQHPMIPFFQLSNIPFRALPLNCIPLAMNPDTSQESRPKKSFFSYNVTI